MAIDMKGVLAIIDRTIGVEGGYSNHPSDRGGPTRWGVTQAKARENGYDGDMRHYPREMAVAVYLKDYWQKPKINAVAMVSTVIAEEMFDTAVNMGTAWPPLFLQQALNGLNRQGADYKDIAEDGDIGPATLGALRAYLAKRGKQGERVMLIALNT
jgi:lysozyme family protein